MRTLLVDSDALWMAEKLRQSYPACQVVGIHTHGHLDLKNNPDKFPEAAIVSLDIPGLDGLNLANSLLEKGCEVIISSEWSTFAYEALRSGVADYLLKPCVQEEFEHSINRVFKRVSDKEKLRDLDLQADSGAAIREKACSVPGYITVPVQESISFIPIDQIIYCKALQSQWKMIMENNTIPLSITCDKECLAQKLSPYSFIQTDSSCFLNLQKVERFQFSKNEFILQNGRRIKVSKDLRQQVYDRLRKM